MLTLVVALSLSVWALVLLVGTALAFEIEYNKPLVVPAVVPYGGATC